MYGRQSIRFGPPETPEIIKQLMIANLVVFIAQLISPSISDLGAVRPSAVWGEGYFWQPFTYMWLHGGFAHIAMNCFALWMFGSELAVIWGKQRFLRYYLLCGIGAGFIIATWPFAPLLLSPGAEAKGVEAYTAVHHFESCGKGEITGPVDVLVAFRRTCADYPLINVEDIVLK